MEYKPKYVNKELVDLYINRDTIPNQDSFFVRRKEFAPHTEEFDNLFSSEQELNKRKNIYVKGNVKMPNTYFDHIKELNSTLNFPMRPTTYTETFEYSDKKKESTLHPDDEYHFKKNWLKEYEECKLKHSHVIRKVQGSAMKV